jgi:hypothetical protein
MEEITKLTKGVFTRKILCSHMYGNKYDNNYINNRLGTET